MANAEVHVWNASNLSGIPPADRVRCFLTAFHKYRLAYSQSQIKKWYDASENSSDNLTASSCSYLYCIKLTIVDGISLSFTQSLTSARFVDRDNSTYASSVTYMEMATDA